MDRPSSLYSRIFESKLVGESPKSSSSVSSLWAKSDDVGEGESFDTLEEYNDPNLVFELVWNPRMDGHPVTIMSDVSRHTFESLY